MGFHRTKKAIVRLEDRLEKLADKLADVERDMRSAKLESLETYDKIHRLFGRIAKRTAIDANPPVEEAKPFPDIVDGIDEISRKIHARRARGLN